MRKILTVIVGLGILAALAGGAYLAYIWFSGEAEPSNETTAPTLEADVEGDQQVYRIAAADSNASFSLQETLRGNRITVVGTTNGDNDIAGDVLVDFVNPAQSQIGTINFNARTLQTDNEFRNRAIRSEILDSNNDEYEFIRFEPTDIQNFPENPAVGDELSFQIVGNLTIKDATRETTWDATVTLVSEDRMEGSASTVVDRTNFGLSIPDAPGVANVAEDVTLEIEFVATAVEEEASLDADTPEPTAE